jgi:hypothetical protein
MITFFAYAVAFIVSVVSVVACLGACLGPRRMPDYSAYRFEHEDDEEVYAADPVEPKGDAA